MKIILYSNDISARSYLMDNSDNQLDLTNFNMCIARMNSNDDYIQHLMDWYHAHMLQRLTTEHESEIPKFNMDDLSYQIESNIGIRVVVALEITQDTFTELRKTPWKDILIVLDYNRPTHREHWKIDIAPRLLESHYNDIAIDMPNGSKLYPIILESSAGKLTQVTDVTTCKVWTHYVT